MADDDLFDRLLGLVSGMSEGQPEPPPLPPSKRREQIPFHRHLGELNRTYQQARENAAGEELIAIVDNLCSLARALEKNETLKVFPAEQLPKLSVGYHELIKNTILHLDGVLTPIPPAAGDAQVQQARQAVHAALLRRAHPQFCRLREELQKIRRGTGEPRFDEFIDALGRALEIIGYDESIMSVEKKAPPPLPAQDLLPRHCRVTLKVSDSKPSSGPGRRLKLAFRVVDRPQKGGSDQAKQP